MILDVIFKDLLYRPPKEAETADYFPNLPRYNQILGTLEEIMFN